MKYAGNKSEWAEKNYQTRDSMASHLKNRLAKASMLILQAETIVLTKGYAALKDYFALKVIWRINKFEQKIIWESDKNGISKPVQAQSKLARLPQPNSMGNSRTDQRNIFRAF